MKSLLISHQYFPPQVGGISRLVGHLARELGPERVCCLTGVPSGKAHPNGMPLPRTYRSQAIFQGSTVITRVIGWGATLPRILLTERPKVILNATVSEAQYGAKLRNWFRLPMVTLVHGNELLAALAKTSEGDRLSRALLQSDGIVAVSRFSAGLASRIGVPPHRIAVVHPGCDAETFAPKRARPELLNRVLGSRPQDRVFLTIGGLVARKGHDVVIRALPEVLRAIPDTTYLIVGDGPCRQDLEKLAAELRVADRVVFAGQVSDTELPDYYALSDVFIMASREQAEDCTVEGFGIVYLEANACGKPVIGGNSGGVPDAVQDGETGLLVDPRSPADIARALISLLTDRDRAARMGKVGRARVVQEFSWSRMAERIYQVLCSNQGALSVNKVEDRVATVPFTL